MPGAYQLALKLGAVSLMEPTAGIQVTLSGQTVRFAATGMTEQYLERFIAAAYR
jgi:hypothetical protein